MKISVITPVYNSQSTIAANIRSVVEQNYADFEHIIIDNLSTDNTLNIIDGFYFNNNIGEKLKIISEKDEGISDAFNKGLNAATGELTVILNSDDEFYSPKFFNDVVEVFQNNPNLLIVHGDIFFEDKKYGSNIRQPLKNKAAGIHFNHPGMFIKKELYNKIGMYNKSFKVSMDFELYCRIYKNYDIEKISYYLNKYPFVKMRAGGTSWENEFQSIYEIKKALKLNDLWDYHGRKFYYQRYFRTIVKNVLSKVGLSNTVKMWRNYKWKNK